VDLDVVWDTVGSDLPALLAQLIAAHHDTNDAGREAP
jgi:uncharacterized protein with HEPN domain